MRFTLSSTALSSKLIALSRVINTKSSLPILSDFVFEVDGNTLRLTASDSENMMKTSVELNESDDNGTFAIGSHYLLEAVKGFSEQPITFEVNREENLAKIIYQNGQFSLPIEDADEFPQALQVGDGANVITIASGMLADNINRSVFATGDDPLRPVMNGIYFDLTQECLTIVASDGRKLVRNKVLTVASEVPASFILPKKPTLLLKNLLGKDGGDVTIKFDDHNAEISFDDCVIACRLIEGRYPNYNSVIPQNNPHRAIIDRALFISALRRVSVFSSQSSSLIKLSLSENQMKISAQDIDFSTSAEETIACQYGGNPMSIGFKSSFLIDILNNISAQNIIIELADPSRAGVIVPEEQEEDEDLLMLLMPMMLND